ncbi:MAG: hypothetical protein WBL11_01770 [Bacteroidales bacterium]|jgi:hypothetical protein|nr:hypothetical protein [Bacteroidales bacterium]MDI9575326.1 hypothetical protein [Bacteroidota bacterium]MDD2592899.1 hypothetical protein [Bacteroidales bacterium]MDD3756345.1 hypothetical protein [Bacteroidales bacterium]MDY0401621.1 hypothetical protein [Bacteroidales bacterium]
MNIIELKKQRKEKNKADFLIHINPKNIITLEAKLYSNIEVCEKQFFTYQNNLDK